MQFIFILILIISLLFLLLGIVNPKISLFWEKNKIKQTRKRSSIIYGFFTIVSFIMFGITSDNETIHKNETSKSIKVENTPTNELILTSIKESLSNSDKEIIKDVKISMIDKEASILIELNGQDNLSKDLIKRNFDSQMSNIYYSLYSQNIAIKYISISIYFPTLDQYGNTKNEIVYTTNLDKEEASKLNWKLKSYELKNTFIPKVWKVLFLHPLLN